MRYGAVLIFASLLILLISSTPGAIGAEEGRKDVNIERYIEFRIEFNSGDRLRLEASIEASPYPVSIFLIKGEDAYSDWVESEDVDVQEILDGKNVSDMNVTFQVVENFSERNTTSFDRSIRIGDPDTYFLIIAIYRDSSMTTEEVMSRASQVDYNVDWSIENKEFPWLWVAFSLGLFVVGTGFIIAYIVSRRRYLAQLEAEEASNQQSARPSPGRSDNRSRTRPPPRDK
ncbi:MAG: hypothetical protein ACMUHM_04550 [Thermoplasmatota archaeon]